MKNHQNILIGMLIFTAAILTTMIVVTQPAYAAGAASEGAEVLKIQQPGKFIMGSAQVNEDKAVLYIINVNAMNISVYNLNLRTHTLDSIDGMDLSRLASFR